MPEYELIAVIAAILFIVVLLTVLLLRFLRAAERRRKEHLRRRADFDAVATEADVGEEVKTLKAKSLKRVTKRFTVIRHIIFPVVLVLVAAVVSIPFLGGLPSILVSIVVAIATVILGVAARPFVENLIGGIVVSLSGLVRVGDVVLIDDHYGTVEDISFSHTTIKEWTWRRYIIPNAVMLNKEFHNYTLRDTYRWVPTKFWVSYNSDLGLVEEVAIAAASKSACFADHEPPQFWITDVAKEAIECTVVAWADNPSDAWTLNLDTRKELFLAFRRHGIKSHSYRWEWVSEQGAPRDSPNPLATQGPDKNPVVAG